MKWVVKFSLGDGNEKKRPGKEMNAVFYYRKLHSMPPKVLAE